MQIEANEYPNSLPAARAAGSKYYYTGKPCRHGNAALRLTSAGSCWCDPCRKVHSGRVNSWQKRHPEKTLPRYTAWRDQNRDNVRVYARDYRDRDRRKDRDNKLKSSYGISIETYEELFSAQDGKCSLCRKEAAPSGKNRLCVDHCHETGRIRGLLCGDCNKSLGVIEKFRDRLETMLHYADHADAIRDAAQIRALQAALLADRDVLQ